MTKDGARLFIALWPGAPLQRALGAWCPPSGGHARTRPVAPARLHLTLHFLGQVAGEQVPALRDALAVPFIDFRLAFSRCERWPQGLLVAVPDAVPAALSELHTALRTAIGGVGLAVESRPFRPHITLARRFAGPAPDAAEVPLCWDVHDYALVQSRAHEGGGYTVLQVWPSRPRHAAPSKIR